MDINHATIIAFLAGEATPDEARRLAEWRRADLEHEREFRRLEQLWDAAAELDTVMRVVPIPAVQAILEKADRVEHLGAPRFTSFMEATRFPGPVGIQRSLRRVF